MALFVCAALKLTLFLGREECEKYHIKPELSFSLVMVVIYFMFVGARQGFPVTNVSFTPSDDSVKKPRVTDVSQASAGYLFAFAIFCGKERRKGFTRAGENKRQYYHHKLFIPSPFRNNNLLGLQL